MTSSRTAGSTDTTALEICEGAPSSGAWNAPFNRARRVGVTVIGGLVRRAWRAEDDLIHPDHEPVSADDTNRDDRPDQNGNDGEYEKFGAPTRGQRNIL